MLTHDRDRAASADLGSFVSERLRARSAVIDPFFAREAERVTAAAIAMAERFERGGRLLAFGRGPYATDAAHLSVEFVHPVIVGKRALPGIDASLAPRDTIAYLATASDIAIALGPPEGDAEMTAVLHIARERGLLTLALPGAAADADFAFEAPCADAHVHQELFELLGHSLYESVQVVLERRTHANDGGAASFLYPFLGAGEAPVARDAVAASIVTKAADGAALRETLAAHTADAIADTARAIVARVRDGGRMFTFGNGGSATDATDFALDCLDASSGYAPVAAHSLCAEPAVLTAIGNDVGLDLVFVRQLIAHARAGDVAFAFSTSGGSKNVVAALVEARSRGMLTVALLGYDGGEIVRRELADHPLVVPCSDIPRIQEAQAAIYHVLREAMERVRDGA